MVLGISIREFARRAGCDDKVVRRKVKTKHIHLLKDGTIDPAYLDVNWRSGDRLPLSAQGQFADSSADTNGPQEAALALVSAGGEELWSKADAETVRENYAARLKQIEYGRESTQVVTVDDAIALLRSECGSVRQRCSSIGAEVAPELVDMTSASEIKALIDAAVVRALADLAAA
ncbi:hypothetical protein [Shinella sp. JR1-6]|uniref:hypothetical protein n=1 Tax=Shinella sp. JR1-6 TaxID=2527671 RepID=UPI00102D5F0B|nr:hypothetical protein [Shinella sp. JR1-6]TAA55285.1 hypothetical protein EXZ48_24955 [Shinella sp. JR1-6]